MEMNASVSECKTKWNSLRTAYNTYLNKLKRLKKPRTKWIHADEMAFLKQYLKRNRYHHNDPMISNDPNSDQSIPETFVKSEDRFDGFDSRLEQQSTLFDLSLKSHYQDIIKLNNRFKTDTLQSGNENHSDVEICDESMIDHDHDDNDKISKTINPSNDLESMLMIMDSNDDDDEDDDDDDDNDGDGGGGGVRNDGGQNNENCGRTRKKISKKSRLIKHFYMRQNDKDKSSHIIGKQELIEGSEEFLTSNQTEEKIVKEQTRRIVLEAPDSVLICLDRNHHKNLLSCNRNNHEQSEIEIFCDFIAKKLKSFSVPIRMDIVTKICQLISEATIREFNFSNTIINNDDDIKESSSHPIILSPIAQMHLKHFEKHFESQKREKSL
ncbi:hypothetical protein QR98_0077430 [Sarcoptes scabiei]|nr:hypothetical protein QR98_0077430 [Sarcoptes scabiei]